MKIIELAGETDASVWVEAWMRAVEARPGIAFDRNAMRGWFGSAIEAGRAAGTATGAGVDVGLEEGVRRVIAAGLATGHADTWTALMDEVLDQYAEVLDQYVGVLEQYAELRQDLRERVGEADGDGR